jgi:ferrous iron transport protein B
MGCCDETGDQCLSAPPDSLTIALAGNPNCGKTALFNALTGIRQKTGNWPGVTVDRKEGRFDIADTAVVAIDMPGIYSLDISSLDEEVTRNYLLSREADLIVNVIDASNLERHLYLTVQLLEMGVPLVLALNMMDIANKRGISIDIGQLSRKLGCPVVGVTATRGDGIDELKQQIMQVACNHTTGGYPLAHEEMVEKAITALSPGLGNITTSANSHWVALKLLENDEQIVALMDDAIIKQAETWQKAIQQRAGEETDIHIADSRFGHAHALTQSVIRQHGKLDKTLSDRIDQLVLSRFLGIPIFLGVMYFMFLFTINIGGAFIDFFDGVAGAIFVDGFGELLIATGAPDWLRVILASGIGGGIQIVATFIPVITALYLFLSAIEDSGYMARAAFVMDRFMRSIGLPGKAFVPLIVGFGCNVPAVMATRTLENERERKLTILMNPFMSCGARLPVYALFAAAFFPTNGQNVVFALYLIGIGIAILTGLIMKKTLLSGESTGFMMELPPYHLPTLKGMLLRTWDRVRLFIKEAGQVIVIMVLVINLLNSVGTDGSFDNEDTDRSVLSAVSKSLTPAFSPMGIDEDNWPAVLGIISGILAKEVVVGTLDTLYSQMAMNADSMDDAETFKFWHAVDEAIKTIPANLASVSDALTDPLGLNVGDMTDTASAAAEQEVSEGTFGAMVERFDGQAGAFAYLLFVLLYFPCVATIGAIRREAGNLWAAFVAAWTTGIAYATSVTWYQLATFSQHPTYSTIWISALIVTLFITIIALRTWARRDSLKLAEATL